MCEIYSKLTLKSPERRHRQDKNKAYKNYRESKMLTLINCYNVNISFSPKRNVKMVKKVSRA